VDTLDAPHDAPHRLAAAVPADAVLGWLYSVISPRWLVASLAITAPLILQWPNSAVYSLTLIGIGTSWAIIMGVRTLTVRRSDQVWLSPLGKRAVLQEVR